MAKRRAGHGRFVNEVHALVALIAGLTLTAQADNPTKLEAFGQRAAASLAKSGSFATCSLEGHEVEEGLQAVSEALFSWFDTTITIRPYGTASMKVCLVLTAKPKR